MWLEISWGVVSACPMLVLLGAMRAVGGDADRIIGVSLHEHYVPQSVAHSRRTRGRRYVPQAVGHIDTRQSGHPSVVDSVHSEDRLDAFAGVEG